MNTIVVRNFGTIISDETLGQRIYAEIKDLYSKNGSVIVDMQDVVTMATFCSKQIFGNLCVELGENEFFDKVTIKNATEQVKTSIRLGVLYALQDK